MPLSTKTISENLARIRKNKGLSQRDLANATGISQRMIAHYENHITNPSIEKLNDLSKALQVDTLDLLGVGHPSRSGSANIEPDVRPVKRFQKLLLLNPIDRSQVYKMIDLLLQKEEYNKPTASVRSA